MRWIGWIRVRDAERDLCGVEHLRCAQGYGPTATENGTAGRGDIHTNAIALNPNPNPKVDTRDAPDAPFDGQARMRVRVRARVMVRARVRVRVKVRVRGS